MKQISTAIRIQANACLLLKNNYKQILKDLLNKGSYISMIIARVLLSLLKMLGKRLDARRVPNILTFSPQ